MTGSDNGCNVNQIKDLRDFDSAINSPKVQVPCAGETPVPCAHILICRVCEITFDSADRRRRFCSDECRNRAAADSNCRRQAQHRQKFPTKELARQALRNAVLLGTIRRPKRCEDCGDVVRVQGHHSDYSRPFYVTWLCRRCHAKLDGGQHFGCGRPKLAADEVLHAAQPTGPRVSPLLKEMETP